MMPIHMTILRHIILIVEISSLLEKYIDANFQRDSNVKLKFFLIFVKSLNFIEILNKILE